MDTPTFISSEEVLSDILNNKNDYGKENWWRDKRFLIRGVTKINLHFRLCTAVNVVYLPLSDLNTVQLPSDYIDYTKIGIETNGHIWTLSLNKNICTTRFEECGVPVRALQDFDDVDAIGGLAQVPFVTHTRNGSVVTPYGLSGGYNHAYYKVDKKHGLIHFEGDVKCDYIVLEYKSSGISLTDNILIPIEALEALLAFIQWQRIDNDDNYPANEKMRKEAQFDKEMRLLKTLVNTVKIHELMDALYSGYKQTTKR
jgi:hypothetical protein